MNLKQTPAFWLKTTAIIIVLFCVGLNAVRLACRKYWFESLPNTPEVIHGPSAATLTNGQTVVFSVSHADNWSKTKQTYSFDLPSRTFNSMPDFELFNNKGELNKNIPVHGNEVLLGRLLCLRSKRLKGLEGKNGVCLSDGKVLVVGGKRKSTPPADSHNKYPDSQGGYSDLNDGHYYLLDPKTDALEDLGAMVKPRCNVSLTMLSNNQILVSGGQMDATYPTKTLNDIELFNYATKQAKVLSPMSIPRYAHCATLLKKQMVLITGGSIYNTSLDEAELYDADSGKSILLPSMRYRCRFHCSHKLSDKHVLLVGGQVIEPTSTDGGPEVSNAQLFCSK
ncbi:MAG: hypothetical protein K2X81_10245 [Candidatus Obscuribacterales bacterium]|nr:hypothetical protein [Candidatus Obscuribacterales bacterium]